MQSHDDPIHLRTDEADHISDFVQHTEVLWLSMSSSQLLHMQ